MAPPDSSRMARLRGLLDGAPKRRALVAGSIASVVIGAVAIIVPLAVAGAARDSSVDTIDVDASGGGLVGSQLEPVAPGLSASTAGARVDFSSDLGGSHLQYAVPASAPWGLLWAASGATTDEGLYCGAPSPAQFEWLATYGTQIPVNWLTAGISNTATSGEEVTVSDIRPQGELTPPTEDIVLVSTVNGCGAGGGDEVVVAHLTLGVDPVAVYDDCYGNEFGCAYGYSVDDPATPGEPVVFQVRPGETRVLLLGYDQTVDFRGRFVATVTVGGQSSTIDLSPGVADIVAPVVTRPDLFLAIGSDDYTTECSNDWENPDATLGDYDTIDCTEATWMAILAAR